MTEIGIIAQQLELLGITLRPIQESDIAWLYEVYASTRQEELATTTWTAVQKQAFLMSQFQTQHHYYQTHYQHAAFLAIQREAQPLGRLYLDHWVKELRIVDIALQPAYRRQGIGTSILKAVLAEGQRLGVPVTIHVERFNPALRLYHKLGFQQIADQGVYYLMECNTNAQ